MKDAHNILNADFINHHTKIQEIPDPLIKNTGVFLYVKRDDLNHPQISGNKWHKLKYNLISAKENGFDTILTFGGAYSNHIHATAAAGTLFGFRTIGIIRGEEYQPLNSTLSYAAKEGMKIHYVDRKTYRIKNEKEFINSLEKEFGEFYLIPEGGTNNLAVKGMSELVVRINQKFDVICCACGTGGTLAGIVAGLNGKNKALGFSVLKGGGFLINDVSELIYSTVQKGYSNWEINTNYHFGGYAKINIKLIEFVERFQAVNNIPIEPVYTGKLFYGIFDLILSGYFKKGTKILAIHTGGMQGLEGMRQQISKIKAGINLR